MWSEVRSCGVVHRSVLQGGRADRRAARSRTGWAVGQRAHRQESREARTQNTRRSERPLVVEAAVADGLLGYPPSERSASPSLTSCRASHPSDEPGPPVFFRPVRWTARLRTNACGPRHPARRDRIRLRSSHRLSFTCTLALRRRTPAPLEWRHVGEYLLHMSPAALVGRLPAGPADSTSAHDSLSFAPALTTSNINNFVTAEFTTSSQSTPVCTRPPRISRFRRQQRRPRLRCASGLLHMAPLAVPSGQGRNPAELARNTETVVPSRPVEKWRHCSVM